MPSLTGLARECDAVVWHFKNEIRPILNIAGKGAWLSWKSAGLIRKCDPVTNRDILRS